MKSLPSVALRLALIVPLAVAALILTMTYIPVLGLPGEDDFSDRERRGWWIFRREGCASCHVLTLSSDPGGLVPDLRKTPRRSGDWHLAHLVDPRAILPGSPMPSSPHLSRPEVEAVIAFLERINRTSTPARAAMPEAIPPTRSDLPSYAAGRSIYGSFCVGCHGALGNGAGRVGHLLAPEPRDFTDAAWMNKQTASYLFSVIGDGKPETAMPGFREALSPLERALVLRYVQYFPDAVIKERMDFGFVAPDAEEPEGGGTPAPGETDEPLKARSGETAALAPSRSFE